MNGKREIRTHRLIDSLIDRAHRDWPGVPCVLHMPTGEEIYVPAHTAGEDHGRDRHTGYFGHSIRPYCECDPAPHGRGTCEVHPLTEVGLGSGHPAYQVDLHSGVCSPMEETPHGSDGER